MRNVNCCSAHCAAIAGHFDGSRKMVVRSGLSHSSLSVLNIEYSKQNVVAKLHLFNAIIIIWCSRVVCYF